MKKFLICILVAFVATLNILNAQTTYTVKSSSTYSAAKIPSQCINCTINIADKATLTIDEDVYLMNSSFNGGAILVNNKTITFWSNGEFNNVTVALKNSASIVNSGTLSITSSAFTFSNNSFATVWASINMNLSSWTFLDNSYMEATGGTFSLKNSNITAGDGSVSSKAYVKFNGATLSENDNTSFVTIANYNNYYYNWSNYNGNGHSIKTTDNKLNCGTAGKNACSSPTLYGPATLSAAGLSTTATLPVKLSAFTVKLSGNKADLTWTTDQEMNSSRFEIEKSTDGIKWTSIGKVAAQGNTAMPTNYTYIDASVAGGTTSYRLKIVDLDESFEYSPIRSVKSAALETHEMRIYPNPATDYVIISSKDAAAMNVKIQLIGMNGQLLKQVDGNGSSVNLSVSEFHAGNYIIRVSDSTGMAQSFKLLIAK